MGIDFFYSIFFFFIKNKAIKLSKSKLEKDLLTYELFFLDDVVMFEVSRKELKRRLKT